MPRMSPRPARRYASVQTAAKIYDVNPRTVYRWISQGRITAYKIGAMLVKVDLNEIEEKVVRVIPTVAHSREGAEEGARELPIGRTRVWALIRDGSSAPSRSAPSVASAAPPWRSTSQG